jgi:hypothetical protein
MIARKRGRPPGRAGLARKTLRETILKTLVELGGRAPAASVLRAVAHAAKASVPADWRKPHPPYRSRLELYIAFERASLRDLKLLDASERGVWKLTEAGWREGRRVMDGTTQHDQDVDVMLWEKSAGWLGRVAGSMSRYPEYQEVLRLGREARRRMRGSR